MSLGSEVSQAVVRDYLLHHGYADTLAAFDRSCACADEEAPKTSAPSPSANGHRCWLLISLGTGILKGETDLRLVFHLATGICASGVLQVGVLLRKDVGDCPGGCTGCQCCRLSMFV